MHNTPQALSWKTRLAIFLPLTAIGSLPLWVYFQSRHEHIIWMSMWMILIVVQFVLSIRTARLAIAMVSGVRKRDGKRIHIDLSAEEAKTYPNRVFKAVFHATWLEHVMLALPRLGVAMGFCDFFGLAYKYPYYADIDILWEFQSFMRPFKYLGYGQAEFDEFQLFSAFTVLVILCLFEYSLAISIGIFWGARVKPYISSYIVTISRVVLPIGSIMAFVLFGHILFLYESHGNYNPDEYGVIRRVDDLRKQDRQCQSIYYSESDIPGHIQIQETGQNLHDSGVCAHISLHLVFVRSLESTQVTFTSFVDNGVLLSTNLLQFSWTQHYASDWGWERNNIPFFIRNILSALLAFGIYGVMILSALKLTQRRLLRQSLIERDTLL